MMELVESVKQFGVLVPVIARPREDGSYELIAGHRRQKACELAGLDSMPVIVMNLDDNDAIIQMVEKLDLYNRRSQPQRRRSAPKPPTCLCESCRVDPACCPNCKHYAATQEDV